MPFKFMKNLFSKIDKLGLILFLLILFNWVYEFSRISFSIEQNIHWRFYLYLFCGLLMVFRSSWLKYVTLLLSLLILIQIYIEFSGLILNFVHFWYNGTIGLIEITPFVLLIMVTIYSLYSITSNLLIRRREKINFE